MSVDEWVGIGVNDGGSKAGRIERASRSIGQLQYFDEYTTCLPMLSMLYLYISLNSLLRMTRVHACRHACMMGMRRSYDTIHTERHRESRVEDSIIITI